MCVDESRNNCGVGVLDDLRFGASDAKGFEIPDGLDQSVGDENGAVANGRGADGADPGGAK